MEGDQSHARVKWPVQHTAGRPDPLQEKKLKVLRFAASSSTKNTHFLQIPVTHFFPTENVLSYAYEHPKRKYEKSKLK